MSIQTPSPEISLTFSHPQQNLRLLELPPELLELLSSPHPPKLYFKSASPDALSGGHVPGSLSPATKAAAQHLHLCTPTHAYQVRQVSTSNSVYVLAPSTSNVRLASRDESSPSTDLDLDIDDDDDDNDEALTPHAMTAIAKIDTMLELLPASHDINPMLKRMLPIYDPPDVLTPMEAQSHFLSHSIPTPRSAIFADLPAPFPQCENAWLETMGIECQGRCARAGPVTALRMWRSLLDHAQLARQDLTGSVDLKAFFDSLRAEPIDAAVAEAVVRRLEDGRLPNDTAHSLRLDRVGVVAWTGLTLLQVSAEKAGADPSLRKEEYLAQWQDLLPEAWREDAVLDRLPEGSYTISSLSDKEVIKWNGLGHVGVDSAQKAAPGADASGKTIAGKRKWHEKFKASRKEIKK